MRISETFPVRFWINLGRRAERRAETECRLAEAGIEAERFAGVDGEWVRERGAIARAGAVVGSPRGEELAARPQAVDRGGTRQKAAVAGDGLVRGNSGAGRYGLALAQRLATREAMRPPRVTRCQLRMQFPENGPQAAQTVASAGIANRGQIDLRIAAKQLDNVGL